MKLTKGERQTLDYYIGGMRFTEIADKLQIDRSNVWRRRERIQNKYNAIKDKV